MKVKPRTTLGLKLGLDSSRPSGGAAPPPVESINQEDDTAILLESGDELLKEDG